jgi:hypothetical protein
VENIPKFDFFVVICDETVAKYTHKIVRITGRPYIELDQNIFNRYMVDVVGVGGRCMEVFKIISAWRIAV